MSTRPNPASKPKVRIFLEGRYRKLVRDLPQTVFYCPECKGKGCESCDHFGKLTKDSVQELMQRRILPRYKARFGKFHGAGREDLDVRMLGRGRPFVYEVVRPRNLIVDLEELTDSINEYGRGRIEITEFLAVPRKRVAQIKETHSTKTYRALVALDEPVEPEECDDLVGRRIDVVQRTPQRVAHRRADKEREREVTIVAIEMQDDYDGEPCIAIEVECQHGTYVKEWISGEEGRSRPSLADLLDVSTRCIALDVVDVAGPFPKLDGKTAPTFDTEIEWPEELTDDPWGLAAPASPLTRSRAH